MAVDRTTRKERLDVIAVEKGLARSREQARRMIMAGDVTVDGALADKPGHRYPVDSVVLAREKPKYVGRGGIKLEAGLKAFALNVEGLVCIDVGSSTGGFTDCLLQHGASRVYAVDVGRGQLEWKLRTDGRVRVMEGFNARYLKKSDIPEPADFAVVDVSFISLIKILPAVIQVLGRGGDMISLIKPQFEAGRAEVGKGGVVRNRETRLKTVEKVRGGMSGEPRLRWLGMEESPIRGPAGNVEYLAHWRVLELEQTEAAKI
ncbi:MAG: TlyA family RNA methyltransferase [Kiritimatiellia bacterium]